MSQPDPRLDHLRAAIVAATERGELPCPWGSTQCTTVDGHWYHADCERYFELSQVCSSRYIEDGVTYSCTKPHPHHNTHWHYPEPGRVVQWTDGQASATEVVEDQTGGAA